MSDTQALPVRTSVSNNYQCLVGQNLDSELLQFIRRYPDSKAVVLIDELVHQLHFPRLEATLKKHFSELSVAKVPRGESAKSFEQYTRLVDFVLNQEIERGTPVFAIGGGVTGDLAGFVAASVMRGLPLVHLPSTLLAMVDSSLGGKTGINHTTGKNLVGAFYQPDAVFADVRFLETLEPKEWVNGLSEVLKYGMIHSPDILKQAADLSLNGDMADSSNWVSIIRQSAAVKAEIVEQDTMEAGKRAYLNFGHTFAHVIELEGAYQKYSHGEAVFAGMIGALQASNNLGANIEVSNLLDFKPLYELNLSKLNRNTDRLFELMKRDKKVKNQQVKLILLHELAEPYIHGVEDPAVAKDAWETILSTFS